MRITQGGGAKAHITINRGGVEGPIRVTATTSPTGVVVKDVILTGVSTEGDLELAALGNAPQGPASVALRASIDDGTMATASFDVFVRGGVGTLDTTYGMGGVNDLGPATFAGGKRSTKHLFVSTGTI